MNSREVPWSEVYEKCNLLAMWIADYAAERKERWDQVELLGVLRGGAICAVTISHFLESKCGVRVVVNTIGVKRYKMLGMPDEHPDNEAEIYAEPPGLMDPTLTVVVDDVLTTGKTIGAVKDSLAGRYDLRIVDLATTAVLYAVDPSKLDLCVEEISKDTWLYFPWEVLE